MDASDIPLVEEPVIPVNVKVVPVNKVEFGTVAYNDDAGNSDDVNGKNSFEKKA